MPSPTNPFIIGVDTREQKPFRFKRDAPSPIIPFAGTKKITMPTGDYTAIGHESEIVIERKSLADLYGTAGKGRKRFERELDRMKGYMFAAIVIESPIEAIMNPNAYLKMQTRMNPRSVSQSLISWSTRYGVHVQWFPSRRVAEQYTYRLLERWVIDARNGLH